MAVRFVEPVVVTVTEVSTAAGTARAAAVEAALHDRPLTVLYADPACQREARLGVAVLPAVTARYDQVAGDLDDVLVEVSGDAFLVVTSAHGRRRAAGQRIAAHASCPTLLVSDGRYDRWRPVVLAVDARSGVPAAAGFAFAEAAARGVELSVLYVARQVPDGALDTVDPFSYDPILAVEGADRLLAEALAGRCAAYPDVSVRRHTWHDPDVVRAIVHYAEKAGLLVVATRDHPLMSDRLLGTVTAALVDAAPCPLAVVPAFGRGTGKENQP
jgi:nucleotide-binding universal stress UspA family protein